MRVVRVVAIGDAGGEDQVVGEQAVALAGVEF